MTEAMPDFLIVGAPKAGTTSLYHYLHQHPQIFMSANKEPHFFAFESQTPNFCGPGDAQAWLNTSSVTQLADYQRLFADARPEQKCAEASTMYLYLNDSCDRIAHYSHQNGHQTKLIAILRHPLTRAYSHYAHLRREGREWESDFRRALEQESERKAKNWSPAWHYRSVGQYHSQIKQYLETFGPNAVKVYLYDDLQKDPQGVYRSIFEFIGVDTSIQIDTSVRHNTTSNFRKNRVVHHFLTQPNGLKSVLKQWIPKHIRQPLAAKAYRKNVVPSQPLSPTLYNELLPTFESDILKLGSILGRDLSHWMAPLQST